MDEKELKETEIWILYEKSLNFMMMRHIFDDTDRNYRFFNGDQWAGAKLDGVEKIQYNFIKPIVKHKVNVITSNLFGINYSPENIENKEFIEFAQKACDLLNTKASKAWDKDFMDLKIKKWARQSCINDEAVAYVTYDFDNDLPINEVISKNDIMYGNENEDIIQLQNYILIRQRKTVKELRDFARKNGVSEDKVQNIVGDNDTATASGISAKNEVEDKCWLITEFYKKDGTVHYKQATKFCDIKDDTDMGVKLYPIAHFNWEDEEGNARGVGEVRQLIPNQLEANKTAMRRAISTKNTAYPQKVIDTTSVTNVADANKVGATIKFKNMGGTKASDVFMATNPAQMSPDSEKLQTELINYSRELNNAGDATTGTIDPEQASGRAILAVQQAQNLPLNDQLIGLKSFIEDIARIWFDMWKTYAGEGLKVEVDNPNPLTGEVNKEIVIIPRYILDALDTAVKVDVTPKGSYDRYAQELSLENLLRNGIISFEEYVESLPADSVMPKPTLEKIIEKRKAVQNEITNIDMQGDQLKQQAIIRGQDYESIENIANAGEQLINEFSSGMESA